MIEIDGHDMRSILSAFQRAAKMGGPVAVIAHTVKGKGVSFMENSVEWHGRAPNADERAAALGELTGIGMGGSES